MLLVCTLTRHELCRGVIVGTRSMQKKTHISSQVQEASSSSIQPSLVCRGAPSTRLWCTSELTARCGEPRVSRATQGPAWVYRTCTGPEASRRTVGASAKRNVVVHLCVVCLGSGDVQKLFREQKEVHTLVVNSRPGVGRGGGPFHHRTWVAASAASVPGRRTHKSGCEAD